ncbi:MAG: 1-(5-phosphoribosyl)-5-amino-4-imidazole-carboxylate carboxylase [Syntrophus sp. (in: bacteria)]|nr:1-(5-phosphoribosyl)-5-amino-4-imidazole-carboxylate carboxylase [Syntrophus sp. (in: bacteria)]
MNTDKLKILLEDIRGGRITVDEGMALLKGLSYLDIGCANLDTHRELRVGYPEVIFCPGKTNEQVKIIFQAMLQSDSNILATRADEALFAEIRQICPEAVYHAPARAITVSRTKMDTPDSYIAVVTAGTSDLPVAEEAAVTAELFGNRVERIVDVGVAGVHRLFDKLDVIRGAKVIIVAAGMEGALPSLVGGLVDKPVIAVPTSVGYGASFHGLAALLSMLNSCAGGVCVVNIDNGFGAGYMASMINKLR